MSLIHVVALWCVYHLLEYAGTVVLWAWLGDLAPQRIRGRFIGRRERWMMLTRIAGMLAGGGFAYWWLSLPGSDPFAYSAPACLGAAAMMAAVLPLLRMPEAPPASYEGLPKPAKKGQGNTATALESRRTSLPELLRPLADRRMRWLLLFGVWFSVANGLTQSAQYLYPIIAVGLTLWGRNGLTAVMRLGQARLAPAAGRFVDRFGNRPLLIVSQLAVATGPLFFILAARLHWSWLAGAWIVWICYVGLNVGLPNLMLKLAGPRQKASYVAWYFALTGIVYGLASIAGGALYTYLERHAPAVSWGGTTLNYHELLLAAGFVLRVLAVVWLLPIAEPGARRWWKMLRLQSQKR